MKVAFVNVNVKQGVLDSRELEFYENKCSIELGSLYLDANVAWQPDDRRLHLNILNEILHGNDWRTALRRFSPDLVALSGLTYYAPEMLNLATEFKRDLGCTIVAGGPHVTAVGPDVMDRPEIDYAIAGEGEAGFGDLLDLLRGADVAPEKVGGLLYRTAEGAVRANPRGVVADLDGLRLPTLAQVDPDEYAGYTSLLNLKVRYVPIVTTRGCPYRCVYCHDIMGKAVRYRSAASVLAEVDYWHDTAGIDTFLIYDDIFNIHRGRVKEIFSAFAERPGLRFAFPNGLRADLLNDELIELLLAGGTFYAMVAVESGDERVQKVIKKRLHLDRTYDVIEKMGNSGVILGAFNILGFPTETEADIERTIAFNESTTGLSKANFFVLNPHQGTEVWDMAVSQGYEPPTGGASKGYFNAHTSSATEHVAWQRLEELRNEAYRRFYLAPGRLDKVLTEGARNMTAAERREFHQVDYSYVLRQFLGVRSLDELAADGAHDRLRDLLPDGLLAAY